LQDEILKVADKLLAQLPESKVGGVELLFDKFGNGSLGVDMVGKAPWRTVNANTLPHTFDMPVKEFKQGCLCRHSSLEQIFYRFGIERLFSPDKCIVSLIDGKQQFVQLRIGFDRFPAFAVQPALAGIPQRGGTRQLATEL